MVITTRINKKWAVAVIALLILASVGLGFLAPNILTGLTTVDIGGGAWRLASRYDGMTVNGETTQLTHIDIDGPLQLEGAAESPTRGYVPVVSVAISGFRATEEADVIAEGYLYQTFDFDIEIKAASPYYSGGFYESDRAIVRVDFSLLLQEGIFADKPEAMIADLTVVEGHWTITNYPVGTTAAEAEALFEDEAAESGYPQHAIPPQVTFVDPPSTGGQMITGGTTEEARSAIKRVELQVGAIYTFAGVGRLLNANPRNVGAHYSLRTVIVSAVDSGGISDGGVNPFQWLLEFFQDLGFVVPTLPAIDWALVALLIGVAIFALALVYVVIKTKR
jgi:hypothetical protein